jgi:hypothetical protein
VIQYDLTITPSIVLALAGVIYTWWRTRDRNVEDKFTGVSGQFKAGSDRMALIEARCASLEQTVRSLPAREDMHGLTLALSDMKGELKAMRAEMAGTAAIMGRVEDVVSRHEQHLMDSRK